MRRDVRQHEPVTLGDLRREGMWMHLLCKSCGERKVEPTKPPFEAMPASTVVYLLGKSIVCSGCGVKGQI